MRAFRRRIVRGASLPVVLAVALPFLVTAASAQAPAPEYGVSAGLRGTTTLAHNHFSYAVPPGGAALHDSVVVSNFSGAPLGFAVHGADMVTAQGGGFAPAAEGVVPKLVGSWLAVEHTSITVPPHQQVSDAFTLTVPAAQLPGEYLGAVVVARAGGAAQGIQVLTRAALIVDVTVQGHVDLHAAAGPLAGTQQRDEVRFSVPVSNRGNVLFTFTGVVTVRDGSGHVAATIPVTPGGVYVIPGGHATVSAVWRGPPWWGSADAVATIHARVANGATATVSSDALHLGFFPWAVVIAALAGVAAAVAAAVLLSRRFRFRPAVT